jgi:ORF6N domain
MAKSGKAISTADEIIVNKIYYIRKQKIMLDRDLAELYGVQAIRLREQVKRNIDNSLQFYVPADGQRSGSNGIAKCDTIKTAVRRLLTLCFYRTSRIDAGKCIKKQAGFGCKYQHYRNLCENAGNVINE